jgi:hypothetical protein
MSFFSQILDLVPKRAVKFKYFSNKSKPPASEMNEKNGMNIHLNIFLKFSFT